MAGVLNGLFGAGGGLVVVPLLSSLPIETKKAHATSIAIILPLSIFSILLSIENAIKLDLMLLSALIIAGLIGAGVGSFLLPKLKGNLLTRIFGVVMIFSASRILLR